MNRIQLKNTVLLLLLLGVQSAVNSVLAAEPDVDGMRDRLQACAGCHAQTEQTATQAESRAQIYYPPIDGKPVEYLYQQLLNFRDGRRDNPLMQQMLAYLSPEYLHEMAAYYAQRPSTHVPVSAADSVELTTGSERARRLVESSDGDRPACTACHGDDLNGDGVAIPGLRGLGAVYITAQLGAWQAGTRSAREPDCMADVAKALDGADIAAIAQWIANAPPGPDLAGSTAPQELPVPCGAVQ
ncbi:c-type cytochrome [Granulosicoccus antarcticus]|uniref:Cytochrome c4 n=1 Tax=Granulosicoccus antarcticus IMCC3135 TaxID=1192854 RepID=A0A2Z2NIC4_9GAMM|nr:c-type cytochrome [Granulosicoccus antarcticus]ASJ70889.1 Cytochrome c4 [Granulosicoccus antarcticus IMCC3135]